MLPRQVLRRETSSLFVILPSDAVFERVSLAFGCLCQLCPARGRQSDPATEARVGAVVFSCLFQLSPARGRESCPVAERPRASPGGWPWLFLFRPTLSLVHLMLSRGVQLCFPLSKLLFNRRILFLARANDRKRDEDRQDKKFFHIRSKL